MTTPTRRHSSRMHVPTALYTAAILVGAMAIPHAVLGAVGRWPMQPFTLHVGLLLLLVCLGVRAEKIETVEHEEPEPPYAAEIERLERGLFSREG